jgi:membrane-bound lytic murein transglycosylase A
LGQVHKTIRSSRPRATPISRRMTHIVRPVLSALGGILLASALVACTSLPTQSDTAATAGPTAICQPAAPCLVCPVCVPAKPVPTEATYKEAPWSELPDWTQSALLPSLQAFIAGCVRASGRSPWQTPCAEARKLNGPDEPAARGFFEARFIAYRIVAPDGREEGLITGYYEPILQGRREMESGFRYPVYGVPDDLIVVDLAELHPELRNLRLRGRLQGRRIVPYSTRAEIESATPALPARPLAWVADAVDLFFLQVQGSGQIELASGERLRLGFADQNGHPYRSLGRFLADRGELKQEQVSMQAIKAWAAANPGKLQEALNSNPSYVFFRELPPPKGPLDGPPGALGVPLTPEYSVAVDPRYIPLGSPTFLQTTLPLADRPLARLVMAQDTGGAIRGAVRADFFWGSGEDAGAQAGRMRQQGRLWLLWPRGEPLPKLK